MTPPEARGRIPDSVKEQIKDRAAESIVEIVSDTVSLKRDGSGYKGLCPFHDEKSPSFHVNTRGTFHCFGCGEGGDAITFIQKVGGGDFIWAMETLAARFGIPLNMDASGGDDNRSRLRSATKTAQEFFADQLRNAPPGHPARNELEKRGFDVEQAIEMFGCGYAPDSFHALLDHLRGRGYKDHEAVAAGLAATRENTNRSWDFFRHRLTWTIDSQTGHPIGFGGRRLVDDKKTPKFLNTPETALYHKSSVLYGITRARKGISEQKHAYVVEGYTDVMAFHLAGVPLAVAACGTAFTKEHLAVLRRLVGEGGEITFALDDDDAGIGSTMKVYDLARDSVPRLTVLPPSAGLDPDDFRRERGDEALRALAADRTPLVGTVIRRIIEAAPRETIEDRTSALSQVRPVFEHVRDPLQRSEYAKEVAGILELDPEGVAARLGVNGAAVDDAPVRAAAQRLPEAPADTSASGSTAALIEREIMAALVQSKDASTEYLEEAAWVLTNPASARVCDLIRRALEQHPRSGGDWVTTLAATEGDDAQPRLIPMLSMLPLNVEYRDVPAHVEELLDGLTAEHAREHRARLLTELPGAQGGRRLEILRDLSRSQHG